MDLDDPSSSSDEYEKEEDLGEAVINNEEIVEDLTVEESIPSPRSADGLQDGVPVIKARAYQTEMMEESLKKNIIVAVSVLRDAQVVNQLRAVCLRNLTNFLVDGYWKWK